jgi:uncharacterized paraquat-inducible protein A
MVVLRDVAWKRRIFVFVRDISKWAMNDVFVVAVYVAFLSAKATDSLDATLEPGFYYFASYCLVSLVALQMMKLDGVHDDDTPGAGGASSAHDAVSTTCR